MLWGVDLFVRGEFWIMVRQWAPTWPPPSPLLLNNNNNIWVPNLLPPYCITPFLPPPFTSCKNLPRPFSFSIFRGIKGMWGVGEDLFQGLQKNCRHCWPFRSKFTILLLINIFPAPPPFLKDPLPAAPPGKVPLHHPPPQERGESWELTLLLPRSYSWVWSFRTKPPKEGRKGGGKATEKEIYIFHFKVWWHDATLFGLFYIF